MEAVEDVRQRIVKTFAIENKQKMQATRASMFATDGSGEIAEAFKRIEAQLEAGSSDFAKSFT